MSRETLRQGVVYSMQMNHGTIDSSGQLSAGVNNGATPQSVHNGTGAYYFDGTNDYIDTNYEGTINSLSFWFKKPNTGLARLGGQRYKTSRDVGNWNIVVDASNDLVLNIWDGSNEIILTSTGISTDTWYNVILVSGATGLKLYVNGELEDSDASTVEMFGEDTESLNFGRYGVSETFYYNGLKTIDEIGIWDKTLSSSEVTSLYNKGYGKQYSELTTAEKTGLVSYYGFNGNADDEHGTNDGTVSGATLQQVKLGTGAYSFDGSNDYIDISSFDPGGYSAITINIWLKKDSFGDWGGIIGAGNPTNPGASSGFHLATIVDGVGSDDEISWYLYGVNTELRSNTPIIDTNWHMLTATYTGSNMSMYIDGKLTNSVSATGNISSSSFMKIGYNHFNRFWSGLLDEPAIWNRALSSSEVTELYNDGDGLELFPNEADGVISYWKFDENTGITAYDSALSGNDGTASDSRIFTSEVDGIINTGADFTQGNDYIDITSIGDISGVATISGWYNFQGSSSQQYIARFNYGSDQFALIRGYIGESIELFFTSVRKVIISSPSTNTWYNIVFVKTSNTNIDSYVNGVYVDSLTMSNLATFNPQSLGAGSTAGIDPSNVYIDEVAIWNRSLSSTEISNLYNGGDGLQYDFTEVIDGVISGTVTLNSVGVENVKVILVKQDTEEYFDDTLTDGDGNYSFTIPEEYTTSKFHCMVEYSSGEDKYNAKSKWDIEPYVEE